jgi:thioredoxin-dependent peroxiredoxin
LNMRSVPRRAGVDRCRSIKRCAVEIAGATRRVVYNRRAGSTISRKRGIFMSDVVLQNGDPAPDFELPSDAGGKVKLSDFRGKRVVLFFYPKDNTSGCTTQACGFRDNYPVIEEKNAVVLGVSPDNEKSHQKFKTKYDLPFTLLVDSDHAVADAYGVWGQKSFMGKKFMGIIRSHFIIDEEGRIADAQVKVSPAESVERAMTALG